MTIVPGCTRQVVILTGASGFLGRQVIKWLEQSEIRYIACARNPHDHLIRRIESFDELPEGEVVIHLAERSDRKVVNQLGEDYLDELLANVEILTGRFNKIIYASSYIVYGDESLEPRKENDPVYATDIYSTGKILIESEILKTNGVVARLSNLYDSTPPEGSILDDLLRATIFENTITIRSGNEIRDFLHVRDSAKALVALLGAEVAGIYNVGSGVGISIKDLAFLVGVLRGFPDVLIREIVPSEEKSSLVLSINKIRNHIDWRPSVGLKQGLALAIMKKRQR